MRNQPECDEQKTKEKDLFETFYFALGNLWEKYFFCFKLI